MRKELFLSCCLLLCLAPLVHAKIVFSARGDIYMMNDDGSNLRRLTNAAFDDSGPRWSPDGKQVVFERDFDASFVEHNQFFIIDADGRNERLFMHNHPSDDRPAWSPDGRHIAFSSERAGEWDIYVVNLVSGTVKQLTHNTEGRMSDRMDWSPDGRKIAYENRAEAGDSIYTMTAAGEQKRLFSPFRGEAPFLTGPPRWSPSGRYIVYPEMERTQDFRDVVSVYIVVQNVFTGHREKHLEGFLSAYACWMGDDRTLIVSAKADYEHPDAQYELYRYHLLSRQLTNLTHSARGEYAPDWIGGALSVFPEDKLPLLWGELKKKY